MLFCLNYNCSFARLFVLSILHVVPSWVRVIFQTTNSSNEYVSCSFELFFVHLNYSSFNDINIIRFKWTLYNVQMNINIVQMNKKNTQNIFNWAKKNCSNEPKNISKEPKIVQMSKRIVKWAKTIIFKWAKKIVQMSQ